MRNDANNLVTSHDSQFASDYDIRTSIADDDFNSSGVAGKSLRTTSDSVWPKWINMKLDYMAHVREILIIFEKGCNNAGDCTPNVDPVELRVGFSEDVTKN